MMNNKNKTAVHFLSAGILCAGFAVIRYFLFDLHGMKQWPLILFIFGIAVIGTAFFANAKRVSLFTALAYSAAFAAGAVFRTEGVDAGGGKTDSLWMIWTIVFACCIAVSLAAEIISARKKKSSASE